jgi:hypothetical protein
MDASREAGPEVNTGKIRHMFLFRHRMQDTMT